MCPRSQKTQRLQFYSRSCIDDRIEQESCAPQREGEILLNTDKKVRFIAPFGRCNFTLAVEAALRLARVLTLR
jgi:hypothetical protein